jgi:hypothetical protein
VTALHPWNRERWFAFDRAITGAFAQIHLSNYFGSSVSRSILTGQVARFIKLPRIAQSLAARNHGTRSG